VRFVAGHQAFKYMRWLPRLALCVLMGGGCSSAWNDPYPALDESASAAANDNTLYTAFTARPKHLDPVQSYTSDEAEFTYQIYEPPLQYDYLQRPYRLIPQSVVTVPTPVFLDSDGRRLPPAAPATAVAVSVYTLQIKPGIQYAPHPAFAVDARGRDRYRHLSAKDAARYFTPNDFEHTGTRELTADDYVYGIKRLAHPRLVSPIFAHMAEYVLGLRALGAELKTHDQHRKATAKPGESLPWLDLRGFSLDGVRAIDKYTLEIKVKGQYPQFNYWLAMPFFAPMPWEADQFYSQPGFAEKNLTLDWWPVGTGPYMLTENDPNSRMVLKRNPHYRGEPYPSVGEPGDAAKGLLRDAGKTMPFIDTVVFSREKEGIAAWNKFQQGYYDSSGVASDNFDQVIRATFDDSAALSADMTAKGIELQTSLAASLYYLGFNWLDPVVGPGATAQSAQRARKLRQALSIAIDWEEFSQIFTNGRAVPAQGPMVPGIFGYPAGADGINRQVYDVTKGEPQRKSIAVAKKLLAEAGYPDGRDARTGAPLALAFDTTSGGPGDKARLDWFRKQFAKLDIQLDIRDTDWNRFQDKIRKGNSQIFLLGWNADYPDPENFLFLLYGPNSRTKADGENASNYANADYDRLFESMKSLPNSPERAAIIARMIALVQDDAPWAFAFHPRQFVLNHAWLKNAKPNDMARNDLKYKRIDGPLRRRLRAEWNQPLVWPLIVVPLVLGLLILPAWLSWRRRQNRPGLQPRQPGRAP
jgi:oligopeptide transport system substrate-binding protein